MPLLVHMQVHANEVNWVANGQLFVLVAFESRSERV